MVRSTARPVPFRNHQRRMPAAGWAALGAIGLGFAFPGCSGGAPGDADNRGPFKLLLASTGLGQLYPYRIIEVDEKQKPTQKVIDILEMDDLRNNVTSTNGVLPVTTFGADARLPGGNPGNQFLHMAFSHKLKPESILSDLPANQANSGLTGSIQVLEYDPTNEIQQTVRGRGFVGGYTYYDDPATPTLDLKLVKAVEADNNGNIVIRDPRANGFPAGFNGAGDLVASGAFVFIPDVDDNPATFETFPANRVIRIIAAASVQDHRDKPLVEEVTVATVQGTDNIVPQVIGYSTTQPQITPGNGQLGVDPGTTIHIAFSKPVQPHDVGQFFTSNLTPPFRGVQIKVAVASVTVPVIYYADPRSPSDLCNYVVKPGYYFLGNQPVTVVVNTTINGLTGRALGQQVTTSFTTGIGPGLVNAPVAPEAIYIGRGGSEPGVSVIDLNGFGQGTGDLAKSQDPNYRQGFKRNPNIGQPGIFPNLSLGTSNMDAGSLGALSLTTDTQGSSLLIGKSLLSQVADIDVGQPLDKVYNNENINANYTRANQTNPLTNLTALAWGNPITHGPIPNPPRLVFPPPNPARAIYGEDPTVSSEVGPPCQASPRNRLSTGNPFSATDGGIGVFYSPFPGQFRGPQPVPGSPQPPISYCPYSCRQQVGHFLYVLDRERKQILVVNSNRFIVLETIKVADPFAMAVAPNLKRLAVTSFSSGSVVGIDIDPGSPRFHQVISETKVGRGPTALAWQPEGEDLLVVNNLSSNLSVLRGSDMSLRKTVSGLINNPLDVVVTHRQVTVGFQTGIYFAYILNGNGSVSIFESGPDGVNGIGFDDVVGIPATATFRAARRLVNDGRSLSSAVWVAHVDETNLGQVSHLELTSSTTGPLPISPNSGGFILPPTFRQRDWTITGRLGGAAPTTPVKDRFSGNSVIDLALDEMNNLGTLPEPQSNQISNLIYADHSAKSQLRLLPNNTVVPCVTPRFLFVGLSDVGKVDVVEVGTGQVVRSIDVPGVRVVSSYWK